MSETSASARPLVDGTLMPPPEQRNDDDDGDDVLLRRPQPDPSSAAAPPQPEEEPGLALTPSLPGGTVVPPEQVAVSAVTPPPSAVATEMTPPPTTMGAADAPSSWEQLRRSCVVDPVEAQRAACLQYQGAPTSEDWARVRWDHPLLQSLSLLSPLSSHDMHIPREWLRASDFHAVALPLPVPSVPPPAAVSASPPAAEGGDDPSRHSDTPSAEGSGAEGTRPGDSVRSGGLTATGAQSRNHGPPPPPSPMMHPQSQGASNLSAAVTAGQNQHAPVSPFSTAPARDGSAMVLMGGAQLPSYVSSERPNPTHLSVVEEERPASSLAAWLANLSAESRAMPFLPRRVVPHSESVATLASPSFGGTPVQLSSTSPHRLEPRPYAPSGMSTALGGGGATTTAVSSRRQSTALISGGGNPTTVPSANAASLDLCRGGAVGGPLPSSVVAALPLLHLSRDTIAHDPELQRVVGFLSSHVYQDDPTVYHRILSGDMGIDPSMFNVAVAPSRRGGDGEEGCQGSGRASVNKALALPVAPNRGFYDSDIVAFPLTTPDQRWQGGDREGALNEEAMRDRRAREAMRQKPSSSSSPLLIDGPSGDRHRSPAAGDLMEEGATDNTEEESGLRLKPKRTGVTPTGPSPSSPPPRARGPSQENNNEEANGRPRAAPSSSSVVAAMLPSPPPAIPAFASMHDVGVSTRMQRQLDCGSVNDEAFSEYRDVVTDLTGRVDALTLRARAYGAAGSHGAALALCAKTTSLVPAI